MANSKSPDLEWHENDMPFSPEFDDHFYSYADGRLECDYVFIQSNSIPSRWAESERFSIGELGFGTGLNFLETWRQWRETDCKNQHLSFTSFELYPMTADQIRRALQPWPMLAELRELMLSNWDQIAAGDAVTLEPGVTLHLQIGDVTATLPRWANSADAWYLDGFAPSKNPDMWGEELMQSLVAHTKQGGTFATYTAAGWVRRNLQAAGFEVIRKKGHAGKRQMMCGQLAASDQLND